MSGDEVSTGTSLRSQLSEERGWILTASWDENCCLWDLTTGQMRDRYHGAHFCNINFRTFAFSFPPGLWCSRMPSTCAGLNPGSFLHDFPERDKLTAGGVHCRSRRALFYLSLFFWIPQRPAAYLARRCGPMRVANLPPGSPSSTLTSQWQICGSFVSVTTATNAITFSSIALGFR